MKTLIEAIAALQDNMAIRHDSWQSGVWLRWHHFGHQNRYLVLDGITGIQPFPELTFESFLKHSDHWEIKRWETT